MKKLVLLIGLIVLVFSCKQKKIEFNPENFIGYYYFPDGKKLFIIVDKYENGEFQCRRRTEKFTMKEVGHNKYQPNHKDGKAYILEYYGEKGKIKVHSDFTKETRIFILKTKEEVLKEGGQVIDE